MGWEEMGWICRNGAGSSIVLGGGVGWKIDFEGVKKVGKGGGVD